MHVEPVERRGANDRPPAAVLQVDAVLRGIPHRDAIDQQVVDSGEDEHDRRVRWAGSAARTWQRRDERAVDHEVANRNSHVSAVLLAVADRSALHFIADPDARRAVRGLAADRRVAPEDGAGPTTLERHVVAEQDGALDQVCSAGKEDDPTPSRLGLRRCSVDAGRGIRDAAGVGAIVEDVPHVGDTGHGVAGRSFELEERREGHRWTRAAERQAQEDQDVSQAKAPTTMLRHARATTSLRHATVEAVLDRPWVAAEPPGPCPSTGGDPRPGRPAAPAPRS